MSEPRIALWHPDFADEPDADHDAIGKYAALLGPFLQTYPSLSVDDYWQLSLTEHAAMMEWLYATGVLDRPTTKVKQIRPRDDDQPEGGVREPRPVAPIAPAGSARVEVPA